MASGETDHIFKTRNPVDYHIFKWSIENYSKLKTGVELRSPEFYLSVGSVWYVTLKKEISTVPNIPCVVLHFYNSKLKNIDLSIKVKLFNKNGICFKDVVSMYNYHILNNAYAAYYFIIGNNQNNAWVLCDPKLYPDDIIVLECKMTFSNFEILTEPVGLISQSKSIKDVDILSSDMKKLLESAKGADIVFKLPECEIPAHKTILMARSEVFSKMFESEMKEKLTGEIEIHDTEPAIFKLFLEYLYTGTSPGINDYNTAKMLYCVSDKYGISQLKQACTAFLASNVTENNVFELLKLADLCNEEMLSKRALDFIKNNATTLTLSTALKNFTLEEK